MRNNQCMATMQKILKRTEICAKSRIILMTMCVVFSAWQLTDESEKLVKFYLFVNL